MTTIRTKKEIAEIFSVSTRTVDKWVAELGLPVLQITPGVVRFSEELCKEWALRFEKVGEDRRQ